MATQRQVLLPMINFIRSRQGKAPLRADGESAPGVTDVTGPVQETLLGKRRDKKGYQDTRMRAGAEAPATSWYKTTLG